ncbi:Coatomer protein complex, beta sub-unit [Ectocarpus siliculosus]|uniref:Coatomer protein complex, beta sub-unit n=1 Tax=Ectocarpus siliculosus TaxID=2880 RepID=D8LDW2_ECTSI|nr:Coatomer protein complex, beta sub-unit [Ectocarpus siliculosus]|eukprot:CBN78519.1 Coatomer protein complex, beta sub-unit [Ectocarpus siliculosus]
MAGRAVRAPGGSDSRFFTTTKKGETHELRQELNSPNRDKKKDAVKKVIANMTVGKDVAMLFTDVINCIQTENIELKKLVYLYLINYAKTQPELTLLAVNTFVKDANDPNPLIRALAVRTMGCIRVEKITEYLCEPLRKALRDDDPYVRKTAAVCVAKLYDINADLVEDQGFLQILRDLICDPNPTVVANAVAALSEIGDTSGRDVMEIDTSVLQKLLAALNECTEWGQVFILDSLAKYTPADGREAEGIIERVTPRLQHANSAVVMSAVKVVLTYLDSVTSVDTSRSFSRKLAPPLVTLLNSEPETQYVALRNINLIVQKRPGILESEIKVFFCKYNDPIYVKMEKLETIIRLVNDRNIDQVLLELKEYAQEVDVEFVRKAVRAIGRCAIKLERAAERCINVLLELIQTKVNYVLQEAVIVIKDIFRKYPNRYESIISALCENLDTLDEPEAKASIIWIIGEYAERIDNADEQLEHFLETFEEESAEVQLQLLTATVKLFLKQPEDTQDMVQRVLQLATEESDDPDLRDRGFVYWRLLSTNPEAAKAVVLSEKPNIADDTFTLEPAVLDMLIGQISTLSSIYYKPPEAFVMKQAPISRAEDEDLDDDDEDAEEYANEDGEDYEYDSNNADGLTGPSDTSNGSGAVDLLSMDDLSVNDAPAPAAAAAAAAAVPAAPGGGGIVDLFGGGAGAAAPPAAPVQKTVVCPAAQGGGLEILGAFVLRGGALFLDVDVNNRDAAPTQQLAVQLNKNTFGIVPAQQQIAFDQPLAPGASASYSLPMSLTPAMLAPPGSPVGAPVQTALKNMQTGAVLYFNIPVDGLSTMLPPAGPMGRDQFLAAWKSVDDSLEVSKEAQGLPFSGDVSAVTRKLQERNIYFVAGREAPGQQIVYYSFKLVQLHMLAEVTFPVGGSAAAPRLCIRSEAPPYAPLALQLLEAALRQ